MSQETVERTYPYILPLDDGRMVVVVQLPPVSENAPQRLVAYELGPIDWATTAVLNPQVIEKMGEAMLRVFEKFKVKT